MKKLLLLACVLSFPHDNLVFAGEEVLEGLFEKKGNHLTPIASVLFSEFRERFGQHEMIKRGLRMLLLKQEGMMTEHSWMIDLDLGSPSIIAWIETFEKNLEKKLSKSPTSVACIPFSGPLRSIPLPHNNNILHVKTDRLGEEGEAFLQFCIAIFEIDVMAAGLKIPHRRKYYLPGLQSRQVLGDWIFDRLTEIRASNSHCLLNSFIYKISKLEAYFPGVLTPLRQGMIKISEALRDQDKSPFFSSQDEALALPLQFNVFQNELSKLFHTDVTHEIIIEFKKICRCL